MKMNGGGRSRQCRNIRNRKTMTYEERWIIRYNEVMDFMEKNYRRSSKYNMEERNNWNWMRHQQKLMGKAK